VMALGISGLAYVQRNPTAVSILPASFDPEVFPVAAVEKARAAGLQGRIFNQFIWGGYLLYAWPEQKVFIDGGTDYYGADAVRTYLDIATLQPQWRARLVDCGISVVLMPTASPMAHQLEHDERVGSGKSDSRIPEILTT
jgi:hypothetical protein